MQLTSVTDGTSVVTIPASGKVTVKGVECAITGFAKSAFANAGDMLNLEVPVSLCGASMELKDALSGSQIGDKKVQLTLTASGTDTAVPAQAFSDSSFSENSKITSVTFGDGVTSVEDNAFYNCISLNTVNWGGVSSIGNSAFRFCAFTSLTIPGQIKRIENKAFDGCMKLTSLTLEDGVKEIGDEAFYNCKLGTINLPNSLTKIGDLAFEKNSSITINYAGTEAGWETVEKGIYKYGRRGHEEVEAEPDYNWPMPKCTGE